MPRHTDDWLRKRPPRPLRPDERALVGEWLDATSNVASAFVSQRRTDDPAIYRRVVVSVGPEDTPSHLVHAPAGMDCWLVCSVRPGAQVRRFCSLRAALNSIRTVFAGDAAAPGV